jgi:transcriptional regulator with XRE-family HTH domain
MPEPLGERIARLRTILGWTQQELAERIAVSRVAISHVELGLQLPSERTIALLAGVFKLEPADLVADTYYPVAKAERLPPTAARYTQVEHELALLERDLVWLDRLAAVPHTQRLARETLHGWLDRLAHLIDAAPDRRTRDTLCAAQARVQRALQQNNAQRAKNP